MTATIERVVPTSRERYVERWLRVWIALGTIVVLVIIGYLIFISSALASINDNLSVAGHSVRNSAGSTSTLPDQIEQVNTQLGKIRNDLTALPGQTEQIAGDLATTRTGLISTDALLRDTAPQLGHTASNLITTAKELDVVLPSLDHTSSLLDSVLHSTHSINGKLVDIVGGGDSGLSGIDHRIDDLNSILPDIRNQLGDISGTLPPLNGHLYNVCRSPAINLLHGPQKC